MALDLALEALTLPDGTEFPGTNQALLNQIAQYIAIIGGASFNGINYGPTTPSVDNQDKPWFKTDDSFNPIGWYSWNGSAWVTIPQTMASGSSDNRPSSPSIGQQYLDTTIGSVIIYSSGGWTTLAGSVGDVKEVKAETLSDALTANPGWIQDADSKGKVIAGAEDGYTPPSSTNPNYTYPAHAYGTTAGEEAHVLTVGELATHNHAPLTASASERDFGDPGNLIITSTDQYIGERTFQNSSTGYAGSNYVHQTMQPTIFYWRLVKSF